MTKDLPTERAKADTIANKRFVADLIQCFGMETIIGAPDEEKKRLTTFINQTTNDSAESRENDMATVVICAKCKGFLTAIDG